MAPGLPQQPQAQGRRGPCSSVRDQPQTRYDSSGSEAAVGVLGSCKVCAFGMYWHPFF